MEKYLEELKRTLQITWSESDSHLLDCLTRGQSKINVLLGAKVDFDKNDEAKMLLLNYCRYDYNNMAEYFEECFAHEILRLQLVEAIKNEQEKS